MKMINRLVEPTSGRLTIDGRDVTQLSAVDLRRGIGYVIQQVGLFPHMTVGANMGVVPRLLGGRRRGSASESTSCWTSWVSTQRATVTDILPSSPVASASAWAWRAPWRPTRP